MKTNSHNISAAHIIGFVLIGACVALSSFCLYISYSLMKEMRSEAALLTTNISKLGDSLENMNTNTQTSFSEQNELLAKSFARETNVYGRLNSQIGDRLNTLNETYTGLLNEQQKQHVSTVEKDREITAQQAEGERLFSQKRYREAADKFNSVLVYQKTNSIVRFYAAYSEFLANPMDSTQYDRIGRIFNELKQSGFDRSEIDTTLEYIKNETGK